MTSAHLFFIPAVLLAGAAFGYVMGRKLLLAEQDEQRRQDERQAKRRAAESQRTAG